ncbi:MAG: hypothetical protein Q9218_004733, partial [Villophora microphyllina]
MPSRGGARHKSGGKGGNRPPPSREETISKAMSYVLRHGAEKERLKLDEGGYINCEDLLAWPRLRSLKVTFPELQDIVATNAKQRFALIPSPSSTITASSTPSAKPSDYLIRANQGHSIKIDSANLLTPLLPSDENCPEEVVHGTFEDSWAKILKTGGLKKMGRQHVHFAMGVPSSTTQITTTPSKLQGKSNVNKPASDDKADLSDGSDDIDIQPLNNVSAGVSTSLDTSSAAGEEKVIS